MNYYERHIGDYAKDTGHLSMLEHGAYTLLIDRYYATEAPIPAAQVHRVARARSQEERDAVDAVLSDFFELREDSWHHKRCDEEIAVYIEGEPERQAKKDNEQLRTKRHRDERARLFAELNAAGLHLPWNAPIAEVRALHTKTCHGTCNVTGAVTGVAAVTAPVTPATPPVTETATAPATPVTAPATASDTRPATAPDTPVTATHSPSPISHSFQNPPTPLQGADDAHTRSPRRPRTQTDASARAWAASCRAIDAVKGPRDKTWAHADAVIDDPKATAAIVVIGGHRIIAARDQFTQGELKRRFRELYERAAREAHDVAALASDALKGMPQ
jgi:uncharacterized protein YdaU (DUF1376 family)